MTRRTLATLVPLLFALWAQPGFGTDRKVYLAPPNPGPLGAFLWSVEAHLNPDPALNIRFFTFNAQIQGAIQQYGGIDRIPAVEWNAMQQRNNQLGLDLAQHSKEADGQYTFSKNIKEGATLVGEAVGGSVAGVTVISKDLGRALGHFGTNAFVDALQDQVAAQRN